MKSRELDERELEILGKIKDSIYAMDLTWKSFLFFYGESKERATFFGEVSPQVSSLLANLLWDATLTRIRALTDGVKTGKNFNLSIGHLVLFCGGDQRSAYDGKLETVKKRCENARKYATKHIAHFDLRTKLNPDEVSVNRRQTTEAVDAIWDFLFGFHVEVLDTHLCRDVVRASPTEENFLELLYLGELAKKKREEEFVERFMAQRDPFMPLPSPREGLPKWLWKEQS